MEYITTRKPAEQWGVSERMVQKYCSQGRIDGVRKFGASWEIPANAKKPKDPRKTNSKNTEQENPQKHSILQSEYLMPLLNSPFEPGHCMEYIENMEDGLKKVSLLRNTIISADSLIKRLRKPNPF